MQVINPASGKLITELETDTAQSVRNKYDRARRAQPNWAAFSLNERAQRILAFMQLVKDRKQELAKTLTREMGKPISQSRNELDALEERVDFFVSHLELTLADELVHGGEQIRECIRHEPLGVITNVSAWNYPYFVGSNVFVPALLTGNAVLYKPSEFASISGLAIADLLHAAGVPNDIFIPLIGGPEVGAAAVAEPVDGVFFTGSHATGQSIARTVGPRLIRMQLELGGKDPAYVAPDVQVEQAAASLADGAFYNTGQGCCAVERIYVHQDVFDDFVDAFVETTRTFTLGDPEDETTYIGPLARREAQLEHLAQQTQDATAKGAQVLLGGKRIERPGFYFEPTVLTEVTHEMLAMQDETFGPLIGLMRVESDQAAASLMNDTRFGLTAAVYSQDEQRAQKILGELAVGSAYWNCCDRVSPRLPWRGRRDSGLGCTLSTYGIEAFTITKAWHLRSP